jgi:hypothetical protein
MCRPSAGAEALPGPDIQTDAWLEAAVALKCRDSRAATAMASGDRRKTLQIARRVAGRWVGAKTLAKSRRAAAGEGDG